MMTIILDGSGACRNNNDLNNFSENLAVFSFALSKAGRFNPLPIGRLARFFHIKI